MEPKKIGEFLKHLRKNKGLSQEQLAEHFYVSSRTVSRWETGKNMPDLGMLIELADFYQVDIREIIDGERKGENMENETKETLKKAAEYATQERKLKQKKRLLGICIAAMISLFSASLFGDEAKGILYGIVPKDVCVIIMSLVIGIQFVLLIDYSFYSFGLYDKISQYIKRKSPQKK